MLDSEKYHNHWSRNRDIVFYIPHIIFHVKNTNQDLWCVVLGVSNVVSAAPLFRRPIVPMAHCSTHTLWDAPILQTSNYSLPPPLLSRWTWTERDGCSFRLFEWLHDSISNPNLNKSIPNPNLNLTSIHTLPLNFVPHCCSAGLLVHLTTWTASRRNNERAPCSLQRW